MWDSFVVHVLHPEGNLSIYFTRLFLFYSLLLYDLVEQVSLLSILHDQIELLLCLNYLIQLDYEGMPKFFHDFQLSADSDNICVLEDKIFLQYFYSYMLLSELMES